MSFIMQKSDASSNNTPDNSDVVLTNRHKNCDPPTIEQFRCATTFHDLLLQQIDEHILELTRHYKDEMSSIREYVRIHLFTMLENMELLIKNLGKGNDYVLHPIGRWKVTLISKLLISQSRDLKTIIERLLGIHGLILELAVRIRTAALPDVEPCLLESALLSRQSKFVAHDALRKLLEDITSVGVQTFKFESSLVVAENLQFLKDRRNAMKVQLDVLVECHTHGPQN